MTVLADKAATLDNQELVYASFPIEKWEDGPDGSVYVYGKATTPEVDTDDQVVDSSWSGKALKDWMASGPNLRVMHNSQRDPAGSGVKVEVNRDGDGAHWVKSIVDEPVAVRLVKGGHLRAYSVGIAKPVIERDMTGKARGGIIRGGSLAELSLVDRPANVSCSLSLVKAAKDGHAEFPATLTATDEILAKAAEPAVTKTAGGKGVTVTLPKSLRVSVSPKDLAKLATFKQQLVTGGAAPAVTKAVTADVAKKDYSAGGTPRARRERLGPQGRLLPDRRHRGPRQRRHAGEVEARELEGGAAPHRQARPPARRAQPGRTRGESREVCLLRRDDGRQALRLLQGREAHGQEGRQDRHPGRGEGEGQAPGPVPRLRREAEQEARPLHRMRPAAPPDAPDGREEPRLHVPGLRH